MFGNISALNAKTLKEALVTAYQSNPTIQSKRAYLRSIDESVSEAFSNWRPTITAYSDVSRTTSEGRINGAKVDRTNQTPYSASVNISQPLFRGFRTINQINVAEYTVMSERSALKNVEQTILLEAAKAYLDVLQNEAVLKLRVNNEQVLKRQLEATQDRYNVGEITLTDVSQAEARLSGAEAEKVEAKGNLQVSRATYRKIIGESPENLKKPSLAKENIPDSLSKAVDIAITNNPAVLSAEFAAKSSRKNIKVVRGEFLPTVTLSGNASRNWDNKSQNDRTDTFYAKANLSVPLYQSGSVSSRLRSAKHKAGKARLDVDAAHRSAVENSTSAWENLQTAKAAIKSRKAQINASKIALDGVEREALAGSRTVLDVLDAEQELLDARVGLVRSERDEMLASFRLSAALGRMTAEGLNLNVKKYYPEQHYKDVKYQWIGGGK
ncbi:MAG: TolC family outer membrane protein [Alphaproteobacteria bacterium]|nr:TolC family outer membrane protein [Alphaproteobacteria bacterium]